MVMSGTPQLPGPLPTRRLRSVRVDQGLDRPDISPDYIGELVASNVDRLHGLFFDCLQTEIRATFRLHSGEVRHTATKAAPLGDNLQADSADLNHDGRLLKKY